MKTKLSQCPKCLCMSKTIKGKCGKCGEVKDSSEHDMVENRKTEKKELPKIQLYICGACKKSKRFEDGHACICPSCKSKFDLIKELKDELKLLYKEKSSEGRDFSYLQGRRHALNEIIQTLKVSIHPLN